MTASDPSPVLSDMINLPPSAPADPSPGPGVSNVGSAIVLSWAPSIDPEGGIVTYEVFIGVEPAKLEKGPTTKRNSARLELPPRGPTVYYWRVFASDPEGNLTVGPLWAFKTSGVPVQEVSSGDTT